MKIMTVLGTRPEIIRLSRIIPLLDAHADHFLVHTGQNYDDRLSGLFFRELGLREPDVSLETRGAGFGEQVGQILTRIEPLLLKHRPDRLLILGDTNSGLVALVARRLGIPVYHMEAGNRCYDDRVPEEVNRRVIDHASTVLMPYTDRSRENLLHEGIPGDRIFVTGNPIKEVIDHYTDRIHASTVITDLRLEARKFFLVTMHRAENVDLAERLASLLKALVTLYRHYQYPVVCSLHPRTRSKLEPHRAIFADSDLRFVEPFGFFDFIKLEQSAFCLITDSGTVQEEGCLFKVPTVTIRDVTERPETIECGSNVLAGCDPGVILKLTELVTSQQHSWEPPTEYRVDHVATIAGRLLLGYRAPDWAEQNWQAQAKVAEQAAFDC